MKLRLREFLFLSLADINMIEADIVYGHLINDPSTELPIMGHPPAITSDISLESFLDQILEFNNNQTNESSRKGVKLDFKSTAVYEKSLPMLIDLWSKMNYPVWINADIYPGPLNNTETIPVDAQVFFNGTKSLPNATLSTGWTTRWGPDFTDGHYTDEQIDLMINGIKSNEIRNDLTFPIRAGIAGQSLDQLDRLYKSLNGTNPVTFTIWSSANDSVDVEKLRKMIFHFGLDKIYVDVPEQLESRLHLDVPYTGVASSLNPVRNLLTSVFILIGLFMMFF